MSQVRHNYPECATEEAFENDKDSCESNNTADKLRREVFEEILQNAPALFNKYAKELDKNGDKVLESYEIIDSFESLWKDADQNKDERISLSELDKAAGPGGRKEKLERMVFLHLLYSEGYRLSIFDLHNATRKDLPSKMPYKESGISPQDMEILDQVQSEDLIAYREQLAIQLLIENFKMADKNDDGIVSYKEIEKLANHSRIRPEYASGLASLSTWKSTHSAGFSQNSLHQAHSSINMSWQPLNQRRYGGAGIVAGALWSLLKQYEEPIANVYGRKK